MTQTSAEKTNSYLDNTTDHGEKLTPETKQQTALDMGAVSVLTTMEQSTTVASTDLLIGSPSERENDDAAYNHLGNALSGVMTARASLEQGFISDEELLQYIDQVTHYATDAAAETLPPYVTEALAETADDLDGSLAIHAEAELLRPIIEKTKEIKQILEVTPDKVRLLGMAWDEAGRDPKLETPLIFMIAMLQDKSQYALEGEAAAQAVNRVKEREEAGPDTSTDDFDRPVHDGFNTYYEDTYNSLLREVDNTSQRKFLEDSLAVFDTLEGKYTTLAERQVVARVIIEDAENALRETEPQQNDKGEKLAPNSEKDLALGLMLIDAIGAAESSHLESGAPTLVEGLRAIVDRLQQDNGYKTHYDRSGQTSIEKRRLFEQAEELGTILELYEASKEDAALPGLSDLDPRRLKETAPLPQRIQNSREPLISTRKMLPADY